MLNFYYKLCYVHPHLDYGDVIYHNQRADLMQLIEQVQYKAALIVSGFFQASSCSLFQCIHGIWTMFIIVILSFNVYMVYGLCL